VGGPHPISADAPQAGSGYDEMIFAQGQGADPDAAWIRLASSNPTHIQIAFKDALIGSPAKFT